MHCVRLSQFVRPVFDAVVPMVKLVILPSIQELKTESAAALPDPEASLGTQKSFVSPSTSDVIRTGSLSTFSVNTSHVIQKLPILVHGTLGWMVQISSLSVLNSRNVVDSTLCFVRTDIMVGVRMLVLILSSTPENFF